MKNSAFFYFSVLLLFFTLHSPLAAETEAASTLQRKRFNVAVLANPEPLTYPTIMLETAFGNHFSLRVWPVFAKYKSGDTYQGGWLSLPYYLNERQNHQEMEGFFIGPVIKFEESNVMVSGDFLKTKTTSYLLEGGTSWRKDGFFLSVSAVVGFSQEDNINSPDPNPYYYYSSYYVRFGYFFF